MEENNGGLGNFLNEVTQTGQNSEQIVYIDIDELESNPKNFYGLRDIDALAGLIAVSHLIEPLTVSKKSNGKFMIISGHRRRAAVQKLLEDGTYTERKLPCIVKARNKITIEQENGEVIEFDEDAVEMLNLIASNRGQREERTVDEKLQEVKYLEAFAKAIFNQKSRGIRGRFRNFFAEEILNISKSQLQRISSMEKLTEKVKQAVDEKKISETAAMELATLTHEEQDACLAKILSGRVKDTVEGIQKWKSRQKVAEEREENYQDTFEIIFKHDKVVYPKESNEIRFKNVKTGKKESVDPQKEAQEWFSKVRLDFYENLLEFLTQVAEKEKNPHKAEQYELRASVVSESIKELKK